MLSAFGWAGSVEGLDALCDLAITNEFHHWWQLGRAGDPRTWLGAAALPETDIDFIRKFMCRGRERPTYGSCVACVCTWVLAFGGCQVAQGIAASR